MLLSSVRFPYDGTAVRGALVIFFDYKLIKKSVRGQVFAVQEDYDKYWSWHKPWFYLLLYAENTGMFYTHQIRDPVKADYKIENLPHYDATGCQDGTVSYYNITLDSVEAKYPEYPITFPVPTEDMTDVESLALTIAFSTLGR